MKTEWEQLSNHQKNVLHYVILEIEGVNMFGTKRVPSIREIGDAVCISSTSVVQHSLERLIEKGFLAKLPDADKKSRQLIIPDRDR